MLATKQFTRAQIRRTEAIATRVHVKRSINRIKNSSIIGYILIEMLCIASEVFQISLLLSIFLVSTLSFMFHICNESFYMKYLLMQ